MLNVSVFGAFAAGLLSFVSPCVLPIVPPYLCYLAGVSVEELEQSGPNTRTARRVVLSAVGFILGFATVFVLLGATATAIGQTVARHLDILGLVAGAVIIVMGLHFLGVFRIAFLYREARVQVQRKPPGVLGAYLMGLAFAFGWTPCVGPVLAAILFVAGSEQTVARGAMLLLVYSLGLGVPFLIAAAFSPLFLRWASRFRRHLHQVERVMGGLLVLTGILFMTGEMSTFSYWLLEWFPALAKVG
ncbi:cytochrome c-type biogenesis protein [Faunimonas pinastri]|uniref:Cytochrome c-type biogenesis protein n=1 Tax=Faunimonas pinastri TaxID=1855383 RepID=A0A1H9JHI9_9HYPH|nr:cytochrome c biogenesis protein CcdA [Faunimonas pinastri]SEQ86461.1 cytochrome c-type biogenesis protein [Faunimonas pinastri]